MNPITKPRRNSALRKNTDVPTLAQMISDGQKSFAKIRRSSREALQEWFAQSERLNIAVEHYRLKGERFIDFARKVGVDKSSAYNLVKLWKHRPAITSRCLDEAEKAAALGEQFQYPGWLTALSWFEPIKHHQEVPPTWQHRSDEWGTPKALFDFLKRFFRFDVDVCASPDNAKCKRFFTKEDNGLKKEWKPGETYWMNPPYSRSGEWVAKATQSAKNGAIVVGLLANRSSTGWYRDHVAPNALVVLLHGRVAYTTDTGEFRTNMSSAPFASILAIWPKEAGDRLLKHCQPVQTVLLAIPEEGD
jgi:phage N-6-adenine-methyltransferase